MLVVAAPTNVSFSHFCSFRTTAVQNFENRMTHPAQNHTWPGSLSDLLVSRVFDDSGKAYSKVSRTESPLGPDRRQSLFFFLPQGKWLNCTSQLTYSLIFSCHRPPPTTSLDSRCQKSACKRFFGSRQVGFKEMMRSPSKHFPTVTRHAVLFPNKNHF